MTDLTAQTAPTRDDLETRFLFQEARVGGVTLAQFVKNSIETMLPYMNTPGADHYII